MLLRDLEAKFLRRIETTNYTKHEMTDELIGADGIIFLCPKCFKTNNGKVGTHSIICWFEGRVPDSATPGPGRWTPSGSRIDDLTFIPGKIHTAISVQLNSGCSWHGFVRDGKAEDT